MGQALGLWQNASPKNFPFDEVCSLFTNVKDPKKQFQVYQNWVKRGLAKESGQVGGQTTTDGNDVSASSEDPYLNSWIWQVCTEFGYWQDSPSRSSPWYNRRVTSNLITTKYYDEQCNQLFKRTTPPAIQSVNNYYQGWNLHLNRTIWINGEWGKSVRVKV